MANLPPDSATYRSSNPDGSWQHNQSLEMQRIELFHLERIAFFVAKTAGFKSAEAELYLFPWEEEEGVIKGDSMEMDEAADWLGWTQEMQEHLNET